MKVPQAWFRSAIYCFLISVNTVIGYSNGNTTTTLPDPLVFPNDSQVYIEKLTVSTRDLAINSNFVIKNSQQTSTNSDLCLQMASTQAGARASLQVCDEDKTTQVFKTDIHSRLILVADQSLCLIREVVTKSNGKKVKFISLKACGSKNKENMWVMDAFEDTMGWKRNSFQVAGVAQDLAEAGKGLRVQKRKQVKKMQVWNEVNGVPSVFNIKNGVQTLNGDDICLEAESLTSTAKLTAQKCSGSNLQKWQSDGIGRIVSSSDSSKCIVWKGTSQLGIGACTLANKYVHFVYNKLDETLLLKKNGLKAFSISGNILEAGREIVLSTRQSNLLSQTWTLSSETLDDTPLLYFIGNPCNDEFESGVCDVCTGDCDNDSDCQGSMRCAQRSNANGLEHVIGCDFPGNNRYPTDDFCFSVQTVADGVINYVGECGGGNYLCSHCEGDCDTDADCAGTLICKQRSGYEAVAGCSGEGGLTDIYAKDVCIEPENPAPQPTPTPPTPAPTASPTKAPTPAPVTPTPPTGFPDVVINGDCTNCGLCTGDCDSDSDCQGDMRCAQRSSSNNGLEIVPGCSFDGNRHSGEDICFEVQSVGDKIINYIGECGTEGYQCGECEGDCDGDEDCTGDLICEQRSGLEPVTGCSGEGGTNDAYSKDICVNPGGPPPNEFYEDSLRIREAECTSANPCPMCYGSCLVDSDCEGSLKCFNRSGSEPIPNCVTGSSQDIANTNYCYDAPTNGDVTYIPGELVERIIDGIRLELSAGLTARLIARSYTPLFGTSFHGDPDAAAVFPKSDGGWIYVSNSEKTNGGVGAIHFDSSGEITNYEMILDTTTQNCGGGKTYWGTWVTCEETSGGQVHEVDPYTGTSAQTVIGNSGGEYESFAYDARNRLAPTFYVTHDDSFGAMVRYTPDSAIVAAAESTGDYSKVLTDQGTSGVHHWLVLNPTSGTFSWTDVRSVGDNNASQHYPSAEGIDIRDGILYFTTKGQKRLFILDLDAGTYTWQSTNQGAFSGQPDQIQRILANDSDNDMLYFCEEAASDNGIHARDVNGDFYRIIDGGDLSSETTGLAFSPDNKHMYVSYQSDGYIFDITREDGYPFGAHRLDIKYHAV